MRYPDGQIARLGDRVRLWKGVEGKVVCSIDTNEFPKEYPQTEWGYLRRGVLIRSSEAGLIHYLEPESSMELIERRQNYDDSALN